MTDREFLDVLKAPRAGERFHYVGADKGYDYFCGEQWALHSYPAKARSTERYFKIKDSTLVKDRFDRTEDVTRWTAVKPTETP